MNDFVDFLLEIQPGPYRSEELVVQMQADLAKLGHLAEPFAIESEGTGGADAVIKGWLFEAELGAPLAILSHGYQAGRVDMAGLCVELNEKGWNAACYDTRGHGLSTGDMTTFGHHEVPDLHRLIDQLAEESESEKVFLGGLSMGGALSLMAATHPKVKGVSTFSAYWDFEVCFHRYLMLCLPGITESVADDIIKMASEKGSFDLDDVSPSQVLADAAALPPLQLMHGGGDELIPRSQAEAIEQEWSGQAKFLFLEEAGHADILGHPAAVGAFHESAQACFDL
jgi:pimeloyl-ACP methyl ester carboxylesterase